MKENEVYFLGGKENASSVAPNHYICFTAIAILMVLAALFYLTREEPAPQGEVLQTVSIRPEDTVVKPAEFERGKDMTVFYSWLVQNLQYPEGLEETEAKVIVRFIVRTDGTLSDFEVIKSSKNKAFEEAVIELLKKSPRWSPAELSDGKAVEMEYTLPVLFKPE